MISLCLTNFNRTEFLYQSFEQVLYDDRISEIVISDDCSDDQVYQAITHKYFSIPKVKIFRNETNLDCYRNKRQAVKHATNEWVLLLDSDNIFDSNFIDVIFSQREWNKSWAYTPEFAKPHFDFRDISGVALSSANVFTYLEKGNCSTMLNAMNYFINREEFLRVWDNSVDPVTSDSLFQNYNWLKGGNTVYVTPGLQYEHRVHPGSHYQNNHKRTPSGFHDSIIEKLKTMR